MADDTNRSPRRRSGPQGDAEAPDPGGPQGDAEGTDSGAGPTTPGPAPDAPQEGAVALLARAEHLLTNVQTSAPNPALNEVRLLIQQAAAELGGSGDNG